MDFDQKRFDQDNEVFSQDWLSIITSGGVSQFKLIAVISIDLKSATYHRL